MKTNEMLRFKPFLEKSSNAKEPSPIIEKYGFTNVKILKDLELDAKDNFCVVKAEHDDFGEMIALFSFLIILKSQDYRNAMIKKYELENILESVDDPDFEEDLEVHVFLFYREIHPCFHGEREEKEMHSREDVHAIKYQDEDEFYLNRRVVIDENSSHIATLLEGLGILVYDINSRHKGATDESILKLGLRKEFRDVLITKDKEFVDIVRKLGHEVIELSAEEHLTETWDSKSVFGNEIRRQLERLDFSITPVVTIVMNDKEFLNFIKPLKNTLLMILTKFLQNGSTQYVIPPNELESIKKRALINYLKKEGVLTYHEGTCSEDSTENSEKTLEKMIIRMNPSHPMWNRLLQHQQPEFHINPTITRLVLPMLHLLSENGGSIDLTVLVTMQVISPLENSTLQLTEQGRVYHELLSSFLKPPELESTKPTSFQSTRTAGQKEKRNDQVITSQMKEKKEKKDRRALMETFLMLRMRLNKNEIPIATLEDEWKQKNRSTKRFQVLIQSFLRQDILSRRPGSILILGTKAWHSTEFLDLLVLYEVRKYPRQGIHYQELKQRFIKKGVMLDKFDEACTLLERQRKIKIEKGYYLPHSLLVGKNKAHFKIFSYVISAPKQQRFRKDIIEHARVKLSLDEIQAQEIITSLIEDDILISITDNNTIAAGPNFGEFSRLINERKEKEKSKET